MKHSLSIGIFTAVSHLLSGQEASGRVQTPHAQPVYQGGDGGGEQVTCATPVCPLTSLPSYTLRYGKLRGDASLTNYYNATKVLNLPQDGGALTLDVAACTDNTWYFRIISDRITGTGQVVGGAARWAGFDLNQTSDIQASPVHFGCGGYHGASLVPAGSISWGGPLQDRITGWGEVRQAEAGVYWIRFAPQQNQVGSTLTTTVKAQVGVTTQELCQDIRESREVFWTVRFRVVAGTCPDTILPVISSTSVTGSTGTITMNASASDNIAISKVEFFVDGLFKGADTTAPYALSFDSATIQNGFHQLVVKVYDAAGNIAVSPGFSFLTSNTTDTTPPDVSAVSVIGSSGLIQFSAAVSDNVAVARVEFKVDGALVGTDTMEPFTCSFDSLTVPNGNYDLSVWAYDAAGNQGGPSLTTSFSVMNGAISGVAPVLSPGNGIIYTRYDRACSCNIRFYKDGFFMEIPNGTNVISRFIFDEAGVERMDFLWSSFYRASGSSFFAWTGTPGNHNVYVKVIYSDGTVAVSNLVEIFGN